jgi:threonine/homoserine/homoserine lactone efflux protein
MVNSFVEGLIAGFGIAIPVGPIAILIIRTSMQNGLRSGIAAGMGAASADFIFAALSAIAGSLIATAIAPLHDTVRLVSGLFLIGLGLWGLRKIKQSTATELPDAPNKTSPIQTYLTLLTLTILNPITIAYFTALILRKNPGDAFDSAELALFVAGAGIASTLWQLFLATIGYILDKALSVNFQRNVTIIGNLVIIGFGISTLLIFF